MPVPSGPSGFVPSNSAPVSGTWHPSPRASPANAWPQPPMPTHMGYPPASLPLSASAFHMAPNQPPIAPSYPTASPFHHPVSPVHHIATPVRHTASPIRQMAASPVQYTPPSSIYHTASPGRHMAFPFHHQASPVHRMATPVRHRATPFHHTASPIQYTPFSVDHMASPIHNGSPHLNSSQTIFHPSQPDLPMSSQTSLPPSQNLSPNRLPTTPIRMMSPPHGSHRSSPAPSIAPFSPGGLSYAPNSPSLSVATVSTRHR